VIRLNYAEPVIGIDSANGGQYTKRQKSHAYGLGCLILTPGIKSTQMCSFS